MCVCVFVCVCLCVCVCVCVRVCVCHIQVYVSVQRPSGVQSLVRCDFDVFDKVFVDCNM